MGNVYFAEYVRWQGACRELFLADHAPDALRGVRSGELALVTVDCRVTFLAECYALDPIEVLMRLRSTSGNRIAMAFEYLRGKDRVAVGEQSIACMRRESGMLLPVLPPEDLAKAVRRFPIESSRTS